MPDLFWLLVFGIPIASIILGNMRKWQKLDLQAAERAVSDRRRFGRLDEIERRVADIERYVTSPEFTLNREIGALADRK
ncbi:MAG TPA: hypothetical protein VED40_06710 [Azospirillaceae bacterium]|nr:hypothetical protein [Azospirillaceae bacterium]